MTRNLKIILGVLAVAVVIGLIAFGELRGRIERLARSQKTEEQARSEVLAPPISTPTDKMVTAKIFWAAGPDKLVPIDVQLPLSADQVQRAKQVLRELIANAPTLEQRTIPADVLLLNFYILPDGTAVADFSDGLASEVPSGILSEQLIIDSIARTLENSVPVLRRLKILIHGQEVDTLAGHVDLTGFFDLNPPAPPQPAPSPDGAAPGPSPSPTQSPAPNATQNNAAPPPASAKSSAPSGVVVPRPPAPASPQGGKP
jgi:Sporulation and spore germination